MTRKLAQFVSHSVRRRPRPHHSATNHRDHGNRRPLETAIADIALERSRAGVALHLLTGKLFESQEALRNVARHSGAKEAWVKIKQDKDVIQLSVIDKGIGIHPDAVRETTGLGLISIRERVQLVNGQLSISASGGGTRIKVRIPISWKDGTK